MTKIDNSITQQIRLYNLIESHLRRAAKSDIPLTVSQLRGMGDIKASERDAQQINSMLLHLSRKGYLKSTKGEDGLNRYVWNLDAPAFVYKPRGNVKGAAAKAAVIAKAPSKAEVVKLDMVKATKPPKPSKRDMPKDIELVVGGTMIVIGRNEATNRLRIVIEEAEEHVRQAQS